MWKGFCIRKMKTWPDNSRETAAVGTRSSTATLRIAGRRWLGIIRYSSSHAMRILAMASVLAVSGCAHSDNLSDQPAQAASQIQSWVPLGTSLAEAQRIMEQHQFKCSTMTNSSFGNLTSADFLYCDRRDADSQITPTVIRRWQIALVLSDGKVSAVKVNAGLTGP